MKIISNIINIGIDDITKEDYSKTIRATNFCIFVSIFNSIFYVITGNLIDYKNSVNGNIIMGIFIIILLLFFYFNKLKMYTFTKVTLLLLLPAIIFIESFVFLSRVFYLQLYFFLFALAPFILFDYQEKKVYFFVILNMILFYIVDYHVGYGIIPKESFFYNNQIIRIYKTTSLIGCFLSLMAIIIFLKKQAHDYQKLLEEKITTITLINKIISDKNKKMLKTSMARDKLFTIIAHDLKSPIGNFLNMLNVVSGDSKLKLEEAEKEKIINELKKSAEKTYNLLTNLLDWVRVFREEINIKREKLDIKNIITEIEQLYIPAFNSKNIEFIVNIKNVEYIYADEKMISTVLRNIISNSIKYSRNGGKIIFETDYINGNVILRVIDSGIGTEIFSKDGIEDKIFFEESERGTEGEKGTGLGLVICKEFIKLNNGKISLTSKVGIGTIVEIILPD